MILRRSWDSGRLAGCQPDILRGTAFLRPDLLATDLWAISGNGDVLPAIPEKQGRRIVRLADCQ